MKIARKRGKKYPMQARERERHVHDESPLAITLFLISGEDA